MANKRAQLARFKARSQERMQQAQEEERRLGMIRMWREQRVIPTLEQVLRSFPCPMTQRPEAVPECITSLLTLVARIAVSEKLQTSETVEELQRYLSANGEELQRAERNAKRQCFADVLGALALQPTLDTLRDGEDGQPVPVVVFPEEWKNTYAHIMEAASSEGDISVETFFEGLEPELAVMLRNGLKGAQELSAEALKESYARQARNIASWPKEEPTGVVDDSKAPKASSGLLVGLDGKAIEATPADEPVHQGEDEGWKQKAQEAEKLLAAAAEDIAKELKWAEGVLLDLANEAEPEPGALSLPGFASRMKALRERAEKMTHLEEAVTPEAPAA